MTRLTITAKGQITLKQDLLRHLNVGPGQQVEADKLPNGGIVVRASSPTGSIDDFIGSLAGKNTPRLTLEEIQEIAEQGWAGEKMKKLTQ